MKRVRAVLTYQGPENTNLQEINIPADLILWDFGEDHKTSVATFEAEHTFANISPGGEYRLTEVFCLTALDTQREMVGLPEIRCRLLGGEPSDSPEFEEFEWD